MVRLRQQETKAFEIRPSGPSLDDEEDEESKLPSRWHLAIAANQIFLIYLYYSIVIPTANSFAASLDAPGGFAGGFAGVLVGASSIGAALVQPLYRLLLKRSYAVTFLVQVFLMLVGSILYALAGLADKWALLLVGRVIGGLGGSAYPILTYLSEAVGKKHRSNMMSIVMGVSRSLGYALGPVFAAALVYVDFHMGELTIDKRNNPGFFVALLCVGQLVAVSWSFPREGSELMDKNKTNERRLPSTSEEATEDKSKREKVMHLLTLSWFVVNDLVVSLPGAGASRFCFFFNLTRAFSSIAVLALDLCLGVECHKAASRSFPVEHPVERSARGRIHSVHNRPVAADREAHLQVHRCIHREVGSCDFSRLLRWFVHLWEWGWKRVGSGPDIALPGLELCLHERRHCAHDPPLLARHQSCQGLRSGKDAERALCRWVLGAGRRRRDRRSAESKRARRPLHGPPLLHFGHQPSPGEEILAEESKLEHEPASPSSL